MKAAFVIKNIHIYCNEIMIGLRQPSLTKGLNQKSNGLLTAHNFNFERLHFRRTIVNETDPGCIE